LSGKKAEDMVDTVAYENEPSTDLSNRNTDGLNDHDASFSDAEEHGHGIDGDDVSISSEHRIIIVLLNLMIEF